MAPEDYQALSAKRGARAQLLSESYPASAEVLRFYGALVAFQQEIAGLLSDWESLLSFVNHSSSSSAPTAPLPWHKRR